MRSFHRHLRIAALSLAGLAAIAPVRAHASLPQELASLVQQVREGSASDQIGEMAEPILKRHPSEREAFYLEISRALLERAQQAVEKADAEHAVGLCEESRRWRPPGEEVESPIANALNDVEAKAVILLAESAGASGDIEVAAHHWVRAETLVPDRYREQAERARAIAAKECVARANFEVLASRDYSQAVTYYEKAFDWKTDHPWLVHFRYGTALWHTGDLARAGEQYDRAIQLNPRNGLLFEHRGLLHQASKKFDKARHDFSKALTLARDNERVKWGLVFSLLELFRSSLNNQKSFANADRELALKTIQELLPSASESKNFDQLYAVASVFLMNDQQASAAKWAARALPLAPNDRFKEEIQHLLDQSRHLLSDSEISRQSAPSDSTNQF